MHRLVASLCLAALLGGPALAAGRPNTRTLTCAAAKALVAREQTVVLASGETAYETVHLDSGICENGESGEPAFMPTADETHCLVGWRCVQRSSDGSSSH